MSLPAAAGILSAHELRQRDWTTTERSGGGCPVVEASHGSGRVESFGGHWAMVSSHALVAGQTFGSSLFGMSRPTTSLSYLFNATLFLFLVLEPEHCY